MTLLHKNTYFLSRHLEARLVNGRIYTSGENYPQEEIGVTSMAVVVANSKAFLPSTLPFILYIKNGLLHVLQQCGYVGVIDFGTPAIAVVDRFHSTDYVFDFEYITAQVIVLLEDGSFMRAFLDGEPVSIIRLEAESFSKLTKGFVTRDNCSYLITSYLRMLQPSSPMAKCIMGKKILFSLCEDRVLYKVPLPNRRNEHTFKKIDLSAGDIMEEDVLDILEVYVARRYYIIVVKQGEIKAFSRTGGPCKLPNVNLDLESDTLPALYVPARAKSARK